MLMSIYDLRTKTPRGGKYLSTCFHLLFPERGMINAGGNAVKSARICLH